MEVQEIVHFPRVNAAIENAEARADAISRPSPMFCKHEIKSRQCSCGISVQFINYKISTSNGDHETPSLSVCERQCVPNVTPHLQQCT